MLEDWRAVVGYEDYYEVSNLGQVRSLDRIVKGSRTDAYLKKGRVLTPGRHNPDKTLPDHQSYWLVNLCVDKKNNSQLIHRLVAKAFVDNPDSEKFNCVNHKDFQKNNNRADNLEWCDHAGNMAHMKSSGRTGAKNNQRQPHIFSEDDAKNIIEAYRAGESQRSIARRYDCEQTSVSNLIAYKHSNSADLAEVYGEYTRPLMSEDEKQIAARINASNDRERYFNSKGKGVVKPLNISSENIIKIMNEGFAPLKTKEICAQLGISRATFFRAKRGDFKT